MSLKTWKSKLVLGHYGVAYYDLVLQRDQGNVGIRTDSRPSAA